MSAWYLRYFAAFALRAAGAPLTQFDITAGVEPPDGAPPAKLQPATLAAFQLAGYNENLEAAFFEEGLQNMTSHWRRMPQFPVDIIDVIEKIAADEEVHVETAEGIVKHFNGTVVPRCKYKFPVNNVEEFLALSHAITNIGIGGVIGPADTFAKNEALPVRNIAGVLAVEARHDAFFRLTLQSLRAIRRSRILRSQLADWHPPSDGCEGLYLWLHRNLRTRHWIELLPRSYQDVGKQDTLFIGWLNQANKPAYVPLQITGAGQGYANIPEQLQGIAFAVLTNNTNALNVDDITLQALAIAPPLPIS
ncbi:hypothetical protein G7Y89_g1965 [Cudoniella acicularis]|uniref:Iminophenyl-pyruvate dimer synthase domain-containing protein n=1 Tax=Cudoniella acicularis TaxID=354080 RepID=A0A8H4RU88_9HELO|nr:hypothetical protein G7Y89_g1965 [Cudoniella acicularis]